VAVCWPGNCEIEFDENDPRGSVVTLCLPRADSDTEGASEPEPSDTGQIDATPGSVGTPLDGTPGSPPDASSPAGEIEDGS